MTNFSDFCFHMSERRPGCTLLSVITRYKEANKNAITLYTLMCNLFQYINTNISNITIVVYSSTKPGLIKKRISL